MAGTLGAVALGAGGAGGLSLYRNRHEVPATYGITVAMRSTSGPWRQTRERVDASDLERVLPGTRVLVGPDQDRFVDVQEEWLSGLDLPGTVAGAHRDLARQAALDLWVLSAGL